MTDAVLVVVKPDAMVRALAGAIMTRMAEAKLDLVAAKVVKVSRRLAEDHYANIKGQPFFDQTVRFLTGEYQGGQAVLALVYSGPEAVRKSRALAGATDPEQADPATLRGEFGRISPEGVFENVVHVSSDDRDAEREIKLWFDPDEITSDLYPVIEKKIESPKKRMWA